MQRPIERSLDKYTWIIAITATAVLSFILCTIATPLLNSGDDAFLMYTLGGGYGELPTNLLHYNYGWHPWLGSIVKNLFVAFPATNWYSLVLLLFHVLGCSSIFYVLLKKWKPALAFFFFLVLFFFFETRLLLSLTFTGTAFVAAAGASFLLIHQLLQKKWFAGNTFIGIILLLLAGMLRLQIVWLVLFLFIPAAITRLNKQEFLRWATISGIVVLLLIGLNRVQVQHYKRDIAGWEEQEKLRRAVFYSYNRPLKNGATIAAFSDSAEQELFFAGFLYDSLKFSSAKVSAITRQITRQRWMNDKEDRLGLYWFFIEMRIYILLFGAVIFSLLVRKEYSQIKKWLLSVLAVGAIYVYLFIFLKITTPIHLGLLMVLWILLAGQLKKDDPVFVNGKPGSITMAVSILLLFGWMGVRVVKEDKANQTNHRRFLCAVNEINQHPAQLFIATDDSFPLGYFYIWDLPGEFPVKNLLYKDRLLTHTYLQTLARFGINDLLHAMFYKENVLLLGPALPALVKSSSPGVRLSDTLPGYQCLEVRRLMKAE